MTKWLFLFLTVLVSLYVLVYFCIIDRSPGENENLWVGSYKYKLKWHACEPIFYPINKLDSIFRPDYLRIGINESGNFVWLDGVKVDWQ